MATKAELARRRMRAEATRQEKRRVQALWWFEERLWGKGYQVLAGMDEAGRGPLAGPVVAAAVILPRGLFLRGINDTKQLTAEQREQLHQELQRMALGIGIGVVDVAAIDRLNILRATWLAMEQALAALPLTPDYVLLDGHRMPTCPYRQQALIAGDCRSISIAAASIVAKVTRDRMMADLDRIYPQWGFAQHKGYSTPEHLASIQQYGVSEIHRRSFAPVYESFQPHLPLED